MISMLKALPTFKEMHVDKDPVTLLKAIKRLTFKFDNEKEYEISLIEAIDKLYCTYQTKDMSTIQYLEKFNNLMNIIEHYGGSIGVHKKITEGILAKHSGGTYDEVNWKLTYIDSQIEQATYEGKEKMLARMFLNRVDCARYGTMLTKLHNEYVTGRRNDYPNDRVSAFALINNWQSGQKTHIQFKYKWSIIYSGWNQITRRNHLLGMWKIRSDFSIVSKRKLCKET
jgi:hypothetical protein